MSFAMKYAMKKRMTKGGMPCMEQGGMVDDVESGTDEPAWVNGRYAEGDMVERIMRKRMSKGGMVANDTMDDMADDKPAQFDDLVLRDDLAFNYDGANSGDEIGNAAMEENDRDLVSRIMRSRAKKDRLPRPA